MVCAAHEAGQRRKRPCQHALLRRGAGLHERRRRGGGQSVRGELAAQDIDADQPHVEDDGLVRLRERLPVQVHAAVLQVPGDEHHRLREIAMRERDTGIGRAARRRRDAGHHLEGDALGGERVDLLAAAPEDERVAALQAHHALAFAREAHQQVIDVLLRQRVLRALLAGVDALGLQAHQVEDRLRHQAVVHHHVGLLHEAQRAEGEQVRIARTGADQRHLAAAEREARVLERGLQRRARLGVAAAEHQLGDRALQHALPETPPFLRLEARLDSIPERAGQRCQPPIPRRDEALQARAQQPRQHRRGAAAGHGHDERRALDDGGQDERAQRGLVYHVHRDAPRPGSSGNRAVHGIIVGGSDRHRDPVQVLVPETRCAVRDAGRREIGVEGRAQFRREHRHPRAGTQQQRALARGHLAAAHHQAGLSAHIEKDRQKVHRALPARRCAGASL